MAKPKPQIISLATLIPAIERAHKRGVLGYQKKRKTCVYVYDGHKGMGVPRAERTVCAIGSVLTDKTQERLLNFKGCIPGAGRHKATGTGCGAEELASVMKIDSGEIGPIRAIQKAHDAICQWKSVERDGRREERVKNFIRLVNEHGGSLPLPA